MNSDKPVDFSHRCRVCNSAGDRSRFVAREMMFGLGGEFAYSVCPDCGSLSLVQEPADLGRYYPPDEYYSFKEKQQMSRSAAILRLFGNFLPRPALRLIARVSGIWSLQNREDTYRELEKYLGNRFTRSLKILDVGCGSGALTMKYFLAGFEVEGLDPYYSGKEKSYFPIHACELPEHQGNYDLITFNDSLEHMAFPERALEASFRLLTPLGVCIISIPKLPSQAYNLYGPNWYALDAPRHLFIPSAQGLSQLAAKTGFRSVESFELDSTQEFVWSKLYQRGTKRANNKAESFLSPAEIDECKRLSDQAVKQHLASRAIFVISK